MASKRPSNPYNYYLQQRPGLFAFYSIGHWLTLIVLKLIPWLASVLIARELAGKVTIADLKILFETQKEGCEVIWKWLYFPTFLFAIVATWYGIVQRNLRRDVIQSFHGIRVEREREKDPERTSSRLTSRGETRPEDQ